MKSPRSPIILLIILVISIFVARPLAAKAIGDHHSLSSQTYRASGRNGSLTAQVSLTVEPLPPRSHIYALYRMHSDYVPQTGITAINIRVDGREIYVPFSAVADMMDISKMSVRPERGGFVLLLSGGDGSEAYAARLSFNRSRVYRKTLSPTGQSSWTERTDYRVVTVD